MTRKELLLLEEEVDSKQDVKDVYGLYSLELLYEE